jgi:hypothetical protein
LALAQPRGTVAAAELAHIDRELENMLRIRTFLLASGALTLAFSTTALAQEAGAPEEPGAAEPGAGQDAAADLAVKDALDTGGAERAGKQYLFLGARYRMVVIPEFIQHAFAEGGETVYASTPGLEFVIRKDQFEYELFGQLGFYTFKDVPFKGASDPATAWEILDANYKILTVGSDFMWSTDDFTPGLSLVYGAGAGLGLVFGDLTRTQAYPPGGTTDPYQFVRCAGAGVGQNETNPADRSAADAYCDTQNDHYNGYVEPSWANGGSSPLIFPWIAANVGLRYKVARQFAMRLDAGLMLTGAFFGLGADFGL